MSYYKILSKTLSRYNIQFAEFKQSPGYLFYRDEQFRKYFINEFKFNEVRSWYGKESSVKDLLYQVKECKNFLTNLNKRNVPDKEALEKWSGQGNDFNPIIS